MAFVLNWTLQGNAEYEALRERARLAGASRAKQGKSKASKAEGLFKQVNKALRLLANDPKHPGLKTHEYDSLRHPYKQDEKVWEAYVQNNTPGAYRIFWCYGPVTNQITIIAITPHP